MSLNDDLKDNPYDYCKLPYEKERRNMQQVLWIDHWAKNTLFWEMKKAPPVTIDLMKKIPILSPDATDAKGLVPGTGSGHDAFALATMPGIKTVVGLDIVSQAIETAKGLLALRTDDEQVDIQLIVEDFFQHSPTQLYDVILDHTFLCALPPSQRQEWARKMSSLTLQGGALITYMFPLSSHSGGPPFALSTRIYSDLLGADFDLEYIRDIAVPFHTWKETDGDKIAIWRKRRFIGL